MGAAPSRVRISARVIDKDELVRRIADAQARVRHFGAPAFFHHRTATRSARIRSLGAGLVPPPVPLGASLRSRASRLAKRVVYRVVYWYVEPRWYTQGELNKELSAMALDNASMTERLQREVEELRLEINDLTEWNNLLQQEVERRNRGVGGRGQE
jgi:hypothetical protein